MILFSQNTFIDLAENSTNNGILTFILGALFILSIYHLFLFFQQKINTYLLYSGYTFLIILAYINKVEYGFLKELVDNVPIVAAPLEDFYRWMYNGLYFIFAFEFLDLKKVNIKWYNYIIRPVFVIIILGILVQVLKSFFNVNYPYEIYSISYVFVITILFFISIAIVFSLKGILKYYIVTGAIILFSTSLIGEYSIRNLSFINISRDYGDFIFYIGVFVESICFSLGLGYKQSIVNADRDLANKKLISKLKENEKLKNQLNKSLSKEVENHKLAEIEALYEKQINELKLTSLLSQMNPHFLFNALNSIKLYIINHEPKIAAYYLNKFSKLIRKILEASSSKEITLQEELETMDLYMNIENIRFSNEINYSIHVDENLDLSKIRVPPLVLQPFLENALWHGLSSKKGDKTILLSIFKPSNEYIQIDIEDNGIGRKASALIKSNKVINRKSIGIELTKERLNNFIKDFKNPFSLIFNDLLDDHNNPKGTKVALKIPII